MPSPLKKQITESKDMQKLLHKRKSARKRLAILILILLITVSYAFIFFMQSRAIQIYSISVSGNEIIDTDAIVADIEKNLSGKYIGLIPKTNIFFYPKKYLIEKLETDYPRFDSVQLSLENRTTLSVVVAEEKGQALWCGMDTLVTDVMNMKSECSFTDENGKIIDSAPYYSGNAYFRFFGADIGFDQNNPLDKTFVTPDKFHDLINFGKNIENLGFPIKAVLLEGQNEDAFLIDLGNTRSATITFNDDDDYDTLLNTLISALKQKDFNDEMVKNKNSLSYLDLRFKNKIYYKFGDWHSATTTTTTSTQQ